MFVKRASRGGRQVRHLASYCQIRGKEQLWNFQLNAVESRQSSTLKCCIEEVKTSKVAQNKG